MELLKLQHFFCGSVYLRMIYLAEMMIVCEIVEKLVGEWRKCSFSYKVPKTTFSRVVKTGKYMVKSFEKVRCNF